MIFNLISKILKLKLLELRTQGAQPDQILEVFLIHYITKVWIFTLTIPILPWECCALVKLS